MSNRFLKFAPNDGVGPDAALPHYPDQPVVRLAELKNARLEAEGRIVPEAGWVEDLDPGSYGVVGVAGCPGVGAYVDGTTGRSALLRLQRQDSQYTNGYDGAMHSCLVPIRSDIIHYGKAYNVNVSPLNLASSTSCGFVVTVLTYDIGVAQFSVSWMVFDRYLNEVKRGTFPRNPSTYSACRAYHIGDKILYVEAATSGGAIFRLYSASESSTDKMTELGSWTPSLTAGEVRTRIWSDDDSNGQMLFERITSNTLLVTGDHTSYFVVTVSPFSVATATYASGSYGTSIRYPVGHRSSTRYDRSRGANSPVNNTMVFMSNTNYLRSCQSAGSYVNYTMSPNVVGADTDWRHRWGCWPIYEPSSSTYRGAWMPGLWYSRFNVSTSTWTTTKLNPTWAALEAVAYDTIAVRAPQEFPGPYIDMGPDGCIVFGGGATRAIYLVSPNSSDGIHSSSSTIHQIGVHEFLERTVADATTPNPCVWDACLLSQNVLVAAGAAHEYSLNGELIDSSRVRLMLWRVIRPGDLPSGDADEETIFAHSGRGFSIVTGGIPSVVSPTTYGVVQLPWLLSKPKAPEQSGASGSGTHLYCCHWVAYAPDGSLVNGPVSDVKSRTLTNSYVYRHGLAVGNDANAKLKVFRTVNNGTTFYLVAEVTLDDFGIAGVLTVTTNTADSSIISNEILYTQGATGALSGRSETTTTPPCRYYYAGTERHIIGGVGSETSVRVSDVLVTGEMPVWPVGGAWYVDVGARVLGVGEMDSAFLVFTTEGVFRFAGNGPDALGEGQFSPPEKVCAVGVRTDRSVVETDVGFMYQGVDCRFYMIRRGGLAAEVVSETLRSKLAGVLDTNNFTPLAECLSSTFSWARGLAYFRMNKMGSSTSTDANVSKLMVFDTRNGTWFEDEIGTNATMGHILWCGADGYRDRPAAPFDYPDTIWFDASVSGTAARIKKARKPGQGTGESIYWWKGYGDPAGAVGTRPTEFTTCNLTEWGKGGWGRVRSLALVVSQGTDPGVETPSYTVSVSVTSDGTTYSSADCDGSPEDGVVEFHPSEQKCSVLQVTVRDFSFGPLTFHGIQLEQTNSGRGRVR